MDSRLRGNDGAFNMTQRWKLTIEYDGTPFVGWQKQESDLSVQSAIEAAIHKFCGETVNLHVAGRTDAGVHATGQVAHVDIEKVTDAETVRNAINAHLRPHPVTVVKAEAVSNEFHARFDATWRVYCYKILMNRSPAPAIGAQYVWHVWQDLDVAAMHEAAQHLLGHHDFSSFRSAACQANSPMRTLNRLDVLEVENKLVMGRHIEVWAEARSFLHHQIRNIVGSLKMVGEGKWEPKHIKTVLEAKDRTQAGAMAPASGLYFVRVDYGN
jgi:tRNA pseudouridine38-40 synthase